LEGPHFRIVPFRAPELGVPIIAERDFTPRPCTTVMDYFAQLQRFFRQYSYIYARSVAYHDHIGQAYNLPINEAFNFIKNDFQNGVDVGTDGFPVETVKVTLDSGLRVAIEATPVFLEFFYIAVHPRIAELLGFLPADLYSIRVLGADVRWPTELHDDAGLMVLNPANINAPNAGIQFLSDFSITNLDLRMSIDLWTGLPVSSRVQVVNEKETNPHILSRFILNSTKEFSTTTDTTNHTRTISEKFQAGMENLTRGNPDYEAVFMLPGQFQSVNLKLVTRYYNQEEPILVVDTDCEDALWQIRVLLSKKV